MSNVVFWPVWEIRVDTSEAPEYLKLGMEEVLGYFPGDTQAQALQAAIARWEDYLDEKQAQMEATMGGPLDAMFEAQLRYNQHKYLVDLLLQQQRFLNRC